MNITTRIPGIKQSGYQDITIHITSKSRKSIVFLNQKSAPGNFFGKPCQKSALGAFFRKHLVRDPLRPDPWCLHSSKKIKICCTKLTHLLCILCIWYTVLVQFIHIINLPNWLLEEWTARVRILIRIGLHTSMGSEVWREISGWVWWESTCLQNTAVCRSTSETATETVKRKIIPPSMYVSLRIFHVLIANSVNVFLSPIWVL